MAFTVDDFEDLYRLLSEHPDWRARLRPLILGDEFMELPARLQQIDRELSDIRASLDRLTEQVTALTVAVAQLAERADRYEARADRTDGRLSNIEGQLLEDRYGRNLRKWLADFVWPPARVFSGDLTLLPPALEAGSLSADDLKEIRAADMLVRGRDVSDSGRELILVVEISQTINVDDVDRAEVRAGLLRRAGYHARGVVGGYRAAPGVDERAHELNVVVDLRRPAA